MAFLKPDVSAVDVTTWRGAPRMERVRPLVQSWGESGFGTPEAVYLLYVVKLVAYAIAALLVASVTTPGMGPFAEVRWWWSHPIVWQKVVIFTLLFEVTGLGCGFGPLTLRFLPPVGAFLYWLRPGTIRLPPWPGLPLTRGSRRTLVDVLLYAAVLASGVLALFADPTRSGFIDGARVLPLVVTLVALGLRDKTIFLAARAEVYLPLALTSLLPPLSSLLAAKLWLCLIWWGAAFSKLNKHFPFVVATMQSNHPILRWKRLKRAYYVSFPDDMRPSRLSSALAHTATAFEFTAPLVLFLSGLFLSGGGTVTLVAAALLVGFHVFILSALPMAVPLEWNVFMIFSVVAIFLVHPGVGFTGTTDDVAPVALFLAGATVVVLGNLFPERFSFLVAMRYYAGNWATSLWALTPSAIEKLEKGVGARLAQSQLARLYGEETALVLAHKGYAFRALHSHGRALFTLGKRAVGPDHEHSHVFMDGELVAGMALGWNFGDGHLHDEHLLAALQERCGFEPGEVRAALLEGQPIHRQFQRYRIVDAATGEIERGVVHVADMVVRQPWADDVPLHPEPA